MSATFKMPYRFYESVLCDDSGAGCSVSENFQDHCLCRVYQTHAPSERHRSLQKRFLAVQRFPAKRPKSCAFFLRGRGGRGCVAPGSLQFPIVFLVPVASVRHFLSENLFHPPDRSDLSVLPDVPSGVPRVEAVKAVRRGIRI